MAINSPSENGRNSAPEVVITGIGVVSPIGIGHEAYWASLAGRRSGVRELQAFDTRTSKCKIAGEVRDFDPKKYVRPRKSLKVMSHDIQLGFAAADLAVSDSGLGEQDVDPERKGVVLGADMIYCDVDGVLDAYRSCLVDGQFDFSRWGSHALSNMYPLWLLKYLPNMPACHVGIAHDARGPNNSITHGEVSSLLAINEAMRVIRRGQADVMISGGASTQINPTTYHFRSQDRFTRHQDDPAAACRPFDATRDGMVHGEGAAAFVLESRPHAEARGANILARLVGYSSAFEPPAADATLTGAAIRSGIEAALQSAKITADDIGHVNANGVATIEDDRVEARAIRDVLGDVAVTAPKSFFGNLGAGAGAVELVATVLAFSHGQVPVTLNYQHPDPECPVDVVHREPRSIEKPFAIALSQARTGQAAALILAAPD